MRLMTYNILTGGSDGASDARLAKVAQVILGVSPDILVLNECNGFERQGYQTFYRLEAELQMRGVLAEAESGFHVGLFFRRGRLLETRCLRREVQHAVLSATLDVDGQRLKVIGGHLSPFGGEARLLEVQHLIRYLREEPAFIVGDLNALSPHDVGAYTPERWLPRRRARHSLAGSPGTLDTRAVSALEACELVDLFRGEAGQAAAPTALTRLGEGFLDYQVRIDYVFATRSLAERVVRRERVDGELADAASDHYPLYIDVEL